MSSTTHDAFQSQCSQILDEIASLPPFRRGTVTSQPRTCGKPSCHCQQSQSDRHSSYQWTATIHGAKFHKTIHLGPEVSKYLDETSTYRRFMELVERLIVLNEKRADQTPLPEPASDEELDLLKKKLQKQLSKPPRRKSDV